MLTHKKFVCKWLGVGVGVGVAAGVVGTAGSSAAGMYQLRPDGPSSWLSVVRSQVLTTAKGRPGPNRTSSRSMVMPLAWRKAIHPPSGDHVGAKLRPSPVSRATSDPL